MRLPHIKNAFEHIKSACDNQLAQLYQAGIPTPVWERYQNELSYLASSDYIDDFEILRCISQEAKKSATLFANNGMESGSFLYFLLNENSYNPLPPHYYCSQCGHFEQVNTRLFGIDLPEKNCPKCGKSLLAEGFNIPIESIWGNDGKAPINFEYKICKDFFPFIKNCLKKLYPNNDIAPLYWFQDSASTGVSIGGFAILPTGTSICDYSEYLSIADDGNQGLLAGIQYTGMCKCVKFMPYLDLEKLLKLQMKTGIYVSDISNQMLRQIRWSHFSNITFLNRKVTVLFRTKRPKTYRDMVALFASAMNTFTWEESHEHLDFQRYSHMTSSSSFKKYPCYTREDIFDFLCETGVERKIAFDILTHIKFGLKPEYEKHLSSLSVPQELIDVIKNYNYIFPRSHTLTFLLLQAKIACYAKLEPTTFAKISQSLNNDETNMYLYY